MERSVDAVEITAALDALSLEQALLDTELANARVVDLTRRLLDAHAEVERMRRQLDDVERGELDRLRAERDELAAFKQRLLGSLPYRLLSRARKVPGVSAIAAKVLRG
jgi:hypothetical protein